MCGIGEANDLNLFSGSRRPQVTWVNAGISFEGLVLHTHLGGCVHDI